MICQQIIFVSKCTTVGLIIILKFTMNVYIPVYLFLVCLTAVLSIQNRDINVEDIIRQKCTTNSPSGERAFEIFKNATYNLGRCIFESVKGMHLHTKMQELCAILEDQEYNCIRAMAESIYECLSDEEKYLEDYIESTYNATVEVHCNETIKKHFHEIQLASQQNLCLRNYIYSDVLRNDCFQNTSIWSNFLQGDYVIRQNDFCSDLNFIRQCFRDDILERCHQRYNDVIDTILDPFIEWCLRRQQ